MSVKYKSCGGEKAIVRLKPVSKLREFHHLITAPLYEEAHNSPISLLDEPYDEGKVESWQSICDPYEVLSGLLCKAAGNSKLGKLNMDDLDYIEELGGIDLKELRSTLKAYHESLENMDDGAGRSEKLDNICNLFDMQWFHPLMDHIFSSHKMPQIISKNLFSGNTRTKAAKGKLCECSISLLHSPAYERGCKICDPIEYLFSSETIRINRNGAKNSEHRRIFRDKSDEGQRKSFEKISASFESSSEIIQQITPLQHLKIVATLCHLIGLNNEIWDEPPGSIEDIWNNYPTEDPVERMKKTIDELLDNNKGWGKENYVDEVGRVKTLKDLLRQMKIVTIHGEGGFGKTELVYQTLKESITDENQTLRYDYLLPFTFKGEKQGEFDITSPHFRTKANQKGWKPIPEFFTMVTELARFQDSNLGDETNHDVWFDKAVEFLINNNVWLIIDNHEVDNDNESLGKLLDKFIEHKDLQQTSTRIIITTRNLDKSGQGYDYPVEPLTIQEMPILAKKRALWHVRNSSENDIVMKLHRNTDVEWEAVSELMKNKLKSPRHLKYAGHPYVVFIAVYLHMFQHTIEGEEISLLKNADGSAASFSEVLANLVEQSVGEIKLTEGSNPIDKLMEYIIGFSFAYMRTCTKIEDARMHLKLTRMEVISLEDLRDIYGTEYLIYQNELLNLEIIVPKNGNNESVEEWEFRTEHHRSQLISFIYEKYPSIVSVKSWNWWTERMKALTLTSKLNIASLRIIGVEKESRKEKQELDQEKAMDMLRLNVNSTDADAIAVQNIVIHFGKVLSEIGEDNNFLLPTANSRSDYREELVGFIIRTIEMGLDGLRTYLYERKEKSVSLSFCRRLVHLLEITKKYTQGGEITNLSQMDQFPARTQLGDKYEKQYNNKTLEQTISYKLRQLLVEAVISTPLPTKHSLDTIRRLWKLSLKKLNYELEGNLFLKIGLSQVTLCGYSESWNIVQKLEEILKENNRDKNRPIDLTDEDARRLGEFIRQNRDSLVENSNLVEFIKELGHFMIKGASLFTSREIDINVTADAGVLIGMSSEKAPNNQHITKLSTLQENSLTGSRVKVKIIPYNIEDDLQYSILEEVLNVIHESVQEQQISKPGWREIDSVSKDEMRSMLEKIEFISIPGAVLFGGKLKEELNENKIIHQGKVWKKWKAAQYDKGTSIESIIKDLMSDKWKVDKGGGNQITVRRVVSLNKWVKEWLNREKGSFPIPKPKVNTGYASIVYRGADSKTPPASRRKITTQEICPKCNEEDCKNCNISEE